MRQGNKGSKRGSMHPYLRIELWANGQLAFWRGKVGYNQDEYEKRLADQMSQERNSSIFAPNIQKNHSL